MLAGAGIAWLLHSSVAAIVLLVALATHGVVPIEAATSLLIGANVGGALIPFGLSRGGALAGRQIMAGNLLLRASWALVVLALLMSGLDAYLPGPSAGGQLVNLHLLFNAALLLLGLPLCGTGQRAHEAPGPQAFADEADERALGLPPSCLDPASIGEPAMALATEARTDPHGRDRGADVRANYGHLSYRRR